MSGSSDNATDVYQVGPHIVELEPPDIVHVHYNGDVELDHFHAFDKIIIEFAPPSGIYLLRDARNGGLVTKATREYVGQRADISRIRFVITYGASFQSRTVFQLMSKGAKRIRGGESTAVFVEAEDEARALITNHREHGHETSRTED